MKKCVIDKIMQEVKEEQNKNIINLIFLLTYEKNSVKIIHGGEKNEYKGWKQRYLWNI